MSPTSNTSSYPPGFRAAHLPGPVNAPPEPAVDEPDPIPVIDLGAGVDGAELHEACSEWGIFRAVNHGVPEQLTARLRAAAKTVFDLPFDSKRVLLKDPNPVYSWGNIALTPAGVEPPKGTPETGLEIVTFRAGQQPQLGGADEEETSITAFRSILEEYSEHMTRLTKGLFESIAKPLKLDQAKCDLNKYLDESTGILRVNRYPPYSTNVIDPQVKGLDAHTDSSVLTVLLQDDVYGLELLKDGLWLPVKPVPNTLIVNVGDMLQAMSDDEYKSVEHKVVLNQHRERLSVGYFVFPEENTVIEGSKGKYKPFTNKDFRRQVNEDVVKVGWKVGLSRFRA